MSNHLSSISDYKIFKISNIRFAKISLKLIITNIKIIYCGFCFKICPGTCILLLFKKRKVYRFDIFGSDTRARPSVQGHSIVRGKQKPSPG